MSAGTAISLLVALAALGISAASLWHSALRPATIDLHPLDEGFRVGGGGGGEGAGIPNFAQIEMLFSLVNLGARAGLVKGIEITSLNAKGCVVFATGFLGPNDAEEADVGIDGSAATFPRTISSGDVWAVRVYFKLMGPFATEAGTTRVPELRGPPPSQFVEMLQELESVVVKVECSYRRGGGWFQRREATATTTASIPAREFRASAARYWRGRRDDLADLFDPQTD